MLVRNKIYEIFKNYPETLTVMEMRTMLGGITKYSALKLIHDGKIKCHKIARAYRVPKNNVIEYMIKNNIQPKK